MSIKTLLHSFFRKKDDLTTTVVEEKTKEELLIEARAASGKIAPELCEVILQYGSGEDLKSFYTKYSQGLISICDISCDDLFSGLKRLDNNDLIEAVLIRMIKANLLCNISDKKKYSLLERDVDRWSKLISFEDINLLIADPNCNSAVLKRHITIKGVESMFLEQRIALEENKDIQDFYGALWPFAIRSQLDLSQFMKKVDAESLDNWCFSGLAQDFISRNRENEIKSLIASVMEHAKTFPSLPKGKSSYSAILKFLNILIAHTSSPDLLGFAEEKRVFVQKKARIDI